MRAQSFLRLAEHNLRITAQYEGPLKLGEDLSAEPVAMSSFGSLEELIEHGQMHRAESQALRKSEIAIRHGVKGANANLYPRLDGFEDLFEGSGTEAFIERTLERYPLIPASVL